MIHTKIARVLVLAVLLCLLHPLRSGSLGLYAQETDKYAPYDDGTPMGWMIIEGDILVPILSAESAFATNFWPGGVVPFEFDANVSPTNQALMLAAMAEWEQLANVDFVVRNGESNYLHIQSSLTQNNSQGVGMMGIGGQYINIANWGSRFVMVHELGHALGYWHEQSRPDRDTYVTINWDNIADACGVTLDQPCDRNFDMESTADIYGPYDFDSVMHYGQCDFSNCVNCFANPGNCSTITVNPPWDTTWQNAIGQRNHLSQIDALTMSFIYPEDDWVFVNQSYSFAPLCEGQSPSGTFIDPFCGISDAASEVPVGGTIIIQPGSYNAIGLYTKAMTLKAPLGSVTLGQ